ncbi:RRM domain protein [Cordyceps fumosorosea ARSEF 2679]|uniref:RRM domain protein n=1 Tax=Cordyceps fumosorosea (strain ARSEF 2679) TaxID=1081104 RepID=A0A167SYA6_CORFA|nr:RRM domain protein [Cordyceps fumosorosea ARSEF 2679]OAA60058.1 RRM domain protein [Cordyceps fumosorosea ARSEF 2679]
MSEEADFEIDFYGDEGNDQQDQGQKKSEHQNDEGQTGHHDNSHHHDGHRGGNHGGDDTMEDENGHSYEEQTSQQGTKRKQDDDNKVVDTTATTALMISELNWWITDDDIRGWSRAAEVEHDLKDLTFSEHKINGKSKGQAYVEFNTRQGATATKHHVDKLSSEDTQGGVHKKITVMYWNSSANPFKTLPKDAPARGKDQQSRGPTGAYNNDRGGYSGNYRGRGNFNNRGNMGQNNYNRNYNNMGYSNMGGGGYNANPMAGGNFNNFNRGGMMSGMRGGMRGGRGGNMMGMNPGMNGMNPMGMPMGMMGGMGNMGNMGMGMMNPGMQGMNNQSFGPSNRTVEALHSCLLAQQSTINHTWCGQVAGTNVHPASGTYPMGSLTMHSRVRSHKGAALWPHSMQQQQQRRGVAQSNRNAQHSHSRQDTYQSRINSANSSYQGMNPGFNPGNFNFGQNQSGGGSGDWGNPHGAKRPRPE